MSKTNQGMPSYWDQAKKELMARDRILKKIIAQAGEVYLNGRGDPFQTLVRSIVGQQLSVKSAETIWQRFVALCPDCTPAAILRLKTDAMRKTGLSARKTEYLSDLALHFKEGKVTPPAWNEMEDEAVIADLMRIRGIGRWTAEMFLIFNLARPNVLPLDDVGLLKGISACYFSGDPVSRGEAREVAANWAPWCTVATWYIWRAMTPNPVEY